MIVKMNFMIITKNHAVDPEKGFLTKSISKPYGHAASVRANNLAFGPEEFKLICITYFL